MPTYVYECDQCEHRFEVFQSFNDRAKRKCPQCRRNSLRKVLFPAGVVFKGSGFYVNDSRSAAAKKSKAGSADSADSSGSGEKGGGGKANGAAKDVKKEKKPAASGSKSGA